MSGILYGVGTGPGAPDLVTLRAARVIGAAKVIAYPTLDGVPSFARSIVADLIPDGVQEIAITVPMRVERAPAQDAYDEGATEIAKALEAGHDVVVLCEGDPLFYGSFMYLFARLSDRFETQIVPGVTSLSACSASAARPLVARNEELIVLPGPLPADELAQKLQSADSAAIMKVGRHMAKIRAVIDDLGLMEHAVYVERATLPEQVVLPLADAPEKAPYFSMILITKGADPWL